MRHLNENINRIGGEPITVRIGGAEEMGKKVVTVTINILPRSGQSTDDLDLATASFIHAQELFDTLERLATTISEGDSDMCDVLEEAQLLINDIRDYW